MSGTFLSLGLWPAIASPLTGKLSRESPGRKGWGCALVGWVAKLTRYPVWERCLPAMRINTIGLISATVLSRASTAPTGDRTPGQLISSYWRKRDHRTLLQGAGLKGSTVMLGVAQNGLAVTARLCCCRRVDQDPSTGCKHKRPATVLCHCPINRPEQAYDLGDQDEWSAATAPGWCRR